MLLRTSALLLALVGAAAPPPPPRKQSGPGEVWSAFFSFNSTNQCATDAVPAVFMVARWAPTATSIGPGANFSLSFPSVFQSLSPMHSKTITGGGATMATDSIGRRGWSMFGTTDWNPHTWIVGFAFPGGPTTQAVATGVCELLNVSYGTISITGGLQYNPAISTSGPWFLWGAQYGQGNSTVAAIQIPPLKPGPPPSTIPPCGIVNVSAITDPAFMPFTIPAPAIGTTASGKPVLMSLSTSQTNASQTNLTLWSAVTGQRVYGPQTFACGDPSYLYTCPPTTGANWPMQGLFGFMMSNGTLVVGGGDWSGQQYFQGVVPLKEEGEESGEEAEDAGGIPVLTYLNSTANQGTWLAGPHTSLLVPRSGKWPITFQFLGSTGGTCVSPNGGSLVVMSVPSADGTVVNATLAGGTISPACPLVQGALPWVDTAVCAGASIGYPDLVTGYRGV